ncbi:hypothetical protein [Halocatena pleomorpha]|uniref:Uncharacterized protein n=1 Tax=Halocatena pleomorpha TaxID=1785090 RepID=A0A3P3RAF4_9EURY|nr:hypothetical protein [Halocatena pleomorpha]RRJ30384.1 hypothetical protein EIK79_10730 [Halocatena pleomorpha]
MFDSDPNDLEGTDVLTDREERRSASRRPTAVDDIEETILRYCWTKTDECPACGCETPLRVGVETEGEEIVSAPDCQLCDAVLTAVTDGVEFDLI